MVLLISDTHVGEQTDEYNVEVFRLRVRKLLREFGEVKTMINKGTAINSLHVVFLGDIVSGEVTYKGQAYNLELKTGEEQVREALNQFEWFMGQLRNRFKSIYAYGVPGNHGRTTNEGTKSNWDIVLYERMKDRWELRGLVDGFEIGKWYLLFDVLGWKYFAFHGDQVRMQSVLPLMAMQRRILAWHSGSIGRFDVAVCGHFHTTMFLKWNDIWVFGNGTMLSGSDYPVRKIGMKEDVAFWVLVVDRDTPVKYATLIDLR